MHRHKARPIPLGRRILFAAIPLVALLALGEVGARIWYATLPTYWPHRARLTNPAYTSKPWFSEKFLAASFQQMNAWSVPPGTTFLLPGDREGRYFTVHDGMRRTTGFRAPSDGRVVRVFLLGGSTTYGSEVPDEWTWPSQLQRVLALDPQTTRVEVLNLGATSVGSAQEVERLGFEIDRGNVPDVVVFFDGVNDVLQGVVNADPAGSLHRTYRRRATGVLPWLTRKSKLLRLLAGSTEGGGRPPAPVDDPARLQSLAEETAERYAASHRKARRLCTARGIDDFVFLQPCLYSLGRAPTEHEESIRRAEPHGAVKETCFRVALPLLRARIMELAADGVAAFDLTDAFDANREPIFLDLCHVESTGNRLIAEAVLRHLQDTLRGRAREAAGAPRR